jgi:hypothetical protein
MNTTNGPPPLTPQQVGRIQDRVAAVMAKPGWGMVSVVIVKGRVVGIKTEISEALEA